MWVNDPIDRLVWIWWEASIPKCGKMDPLHYGLAYGLSQEKKCFRVSEFRFGFLYWWWFWFGFRIQIWFLIFWIWTQVWFWKHGPVRTRSSMVLLATMVHHFRGGNFGCNLLTWLGPNMSGSTIFWFDPTTRKLNGMNTGWTLTIQGGHE